MYLYLILICVATLAIAIASAISSTKGLADPENPARDQIAAFFRDKKATCAENAVSKDELPFWMLKSSFESNVFKAMLKKKLVVKCDKSYYLDEGALKYILGK